MLVNCERIYETVNKEWNEKLVLSKASSSEKKCTQKKKKNKKQTSLVPPQNKNQTRMVGLFEEGY